MRPKTSEFLIFSSGPPIRSFRNLTDSFESWAYRNGLLRQMSLLEDKQLIERDASSQKEQSDK